LRTTPQSTTKRVMRSPTLPEAARSGRAGRGRVGLAAARLRAHRDLALRPELHAEVVLRGLRPG